MWGKTMKTITSRIEVLSPYEIEQVHQATLEVLATVGCRLPHPRILSMLEERGAAVDYETGIARLPKELVEAILHETRPSCDETAPAPFVRSQFRIHPGNQANIIDYQAASRRQGTTEDVLKGIVLTNELPYVYDTMPLVTPSDVPGYMQDMY
jgi:trimethylamine--corrinoid protein Co-methyltransferase